MKLISAICLIFFLLSLISCEENPIKKIDETMKGFSRTVHKIDTVSKKMSDGLGKFARHVEKYVDTTQYKKDSTGMWKKKN